jgi:hypothetical protein
VKIDLAAGSTTAVQVLATVAESAPAGKRAMGLRLVRADGTTEQQWQASIEYLGRRGRAVIRPIEDAYVVQRYPNLNKGSATVVVIDGGDRAVGDRDHSLAYLKFRVDVPGRPLTVRLRLHNAGNPTADCGRVCLVSEPWNEKTLTYATRPAIGPEVARLRSVAENQVVEIPLQIDLTGRRELSLAIDPTTCDGVDFFSRESDHPPELVIDYEARK